MFDFFKKNIIESGLLSGVIDYHTHILPGVDDGVRTLESALELLSWYEWLGVKRVLLTPHIMEDYSENNPESLRRHFERLQAAYVGDIELKLAGEYMLDGAFMSHLERGGLLTVHDNIVLVECSYLNKPYNFEGMLDSIQSEGYHILLAHPERYGFMSMAEYDLLKRRHVGFQLNLLSLTGSYGKNAQRVARQLLHKGYYQVMGSDIHMLSFHQREYARKVLTKKDVLALERLADLEAISTIFL